MYFNDDDDHHHHLSSLQSVFSLILKVQGFYEWFSSIFVFSQLHADFQVCQISSSHFTPYYVHFKYTLVNLFIFALFISELIKSSFLTEQVSIPHCITLRKQEEYNVHLVPKGKYLLIRQDNESLNSLRLCLVLTKTLSTTSLLAPIVSSR